MALASLAAVIHPWVNRFLSELMRATKSIFLFCSIYIATVLPFVGEARADLLDTKYDVRFWNSVNNRTTFATNRDFDNAVETYNWTAAGMTISLSIDSVNKSISFNSNSGVNGFEFVVSDLGTNFRRFTGLSVDTSPGGLDWTVTAEDNRLIARPNPTNTSISNAGTYEFSYSELPLASVSSVRADTANGSYNDDDTILIEVVFDEAVVVTGSPTLTLETGTTDRTASFDSYSGDTVVFAYDVQDGDTASDLNYTSTTSLTLNGGTIKAASDDTTANITLPAVGSSNSLSSNAGIVIDTTHPTTTSVDAPADQAYKAGENLSFSDDHTTLLEGLPYLIIKCCYKCSVCIRHWQPL
ncbi:hypothetical protein N9769_09190 [Ascidiaceihabitans sp.]|nr:hypothetical protein [Ascidiaceihabitans sp.]